MSSLATAQSLASAPSVDDAIAMVRLQRDATYEHHGRAGVFSPDGRLFAFVTWRGDLASNKNVFSLSVLDLSLPRMPARAILSWDFEGDPENQRASPFEQTTFLEDSRTIAFLGRRGTAPQQVFSVNVDTGRLVQLTHHHENVRSFIADSKHGVRLYSAVAPDKNWPSIHARLNDDGVFLWDRSVFPLPPAASFRAGVALTSSARMAREYFLVENGKPTKILDSSRLASDSPLRDEDTLSRWSTLTRDPAGRYALVYPYVPAADAVRTRSYAHYDYRDHPADAFYGLVDLTTGDLQTFFPAPHPRMSGGPVWSPDGRSVLIFSLLPIAEGTEHAQRQPPQWIEVEVSSRRYRPVNLSADWTVMHWSAERQALIARRGLEFGLVARDPVSGWSAVTPLAVAKEMNPAWAPATDGRTTIGVRETASSPPDLVAFDLTARKLTVLTDFNPQLRARRFINAEEFRWSSPVDANASGLLVKPPEFTQGTRYPLIVLLDDGVLGRDRQRYLLDGADQLSAHAIQMLAARGFMILNTREPPHTISQPEECHRMAAHIEAAVRRLADTGTVDPGRVGISGFSRAAYHVDCALIHSEFPFEGAAQVDGGGRAYTPRDRPFTDAELLRIQTPLLIESHGELSLARHSQMADRLEAFGRPTEILYFASAPHSTTRPQHRKRSLQTHIDWWQFWLQGVEDPDVLKRNQYLHWRALRERHQALRAQPRTAAP